jgi:methyl-accepting chemotaxis protein
VNQILGMIDEIAFQTNLLALNAGVEAARAGRRRQGLRGRRSGSPGPGPALVRGGQRDQVADHRAAARSAKVSTSSARRATALRGIHEKVGGIDELVNAIAASASEQATALNQVNSAVNQLDQVTQRNAAMVSQSTEATHALRVEAADLSNRVGAFRVGASAEPKASQPTYRRRPKTRCTPPALAWRPSRVPGR